MKRARRQKGIIRCGIITSIVMLMGYGLVRYTQAIIACAPITVIHDALLSPSYATQLAQDITNGIHRWGPQTIATQCANYSPILSSLEVTYTIPFHGMVKYALQSPHACLNNIVALLPDGRLVSTELFDQQFSAELPQIAVPNSLLSTSQAPEALRVLTAAISSDLLQRFTCEWYDCNKTVYHDTHNQQYSLVCGGQEELQLHDLAVYDAVLMQHASDRTKKTQWLVDLRFKNQVVVSPDGGV